MSLKKRFLISILRRLSLSKAKLFICIIIFLGYLILNREIPVEQHEQKQVISYFDQNVKTYNYLKHYKIIQNYKRKEHTNPEWKTIIPKNRQTKSNGDDFLILEYTKIFGATKYCHLFNNSDTMKVKQNLYVNECPYKNCIFTCDQTRLKESHALLFHLADTENLVKNDKEFYTNLTSSITNRQDQLWILWNDEANPVSNVVDMFGFNWTMSYRLDSEISDCSYGCKYSKVSENLDLLKHKIRTEFKKRKNEAVWFVSNSEPQYRLKFTHELKKFYPITVHGSCRKFFQKEKFWFNFWIKDEDECGRDSNCEYDALTNNKFYLAFESKNCTNYLTEKVWKMLNIGIIPIVIQPSKSFYELNLPPNSYIHAQDFGFDAKKLADYLNFVGSNFEVYYSFLKWKSDYDIVFSALQTERRRLCELCTKLNTETSVIYYNKVSEFFNDKCFVN